jgi:3'-phosphoadenosine 5'-phosphosulfate sulfotransferase (PAPS reductase)/FAD synthetase
MLDFETKLTNAQHRIEDLYNATNGQCYLSFSGGKDSTVILAIIKQCIEIGTLPQEGIKAIFCNTGIELNATVDFVNWVKENYYSNVEIIRPTVNFDWVIKNKGKPMRSKIKSDYIHRYHSGAKGLYLEYLLDKSGYHQKTVLANKDMHFLSSDFDINVNNSCCNFLKKKPFHDYNKLNQIKGYFIGERMAEGGVRELSEKNRLKNGGNVCTRTKGDLIIKLPIIDWSDDDIQQFITRYNIPLSKAYTLYGLTRTGCIGCPFSQSLEYSLEVLFKYEPNKYKASMYWLKDVYIAQGVKLLFDMEYMQEFNSKWELCYSLMRREMLEKYRPETADRKDYEQLTLL